MDVKDAFSHDILPTSDKIYGRLPTRECMSFISGQVVKLKKSRYVICQARKLWYYFLSREKTKAGIRRSMSSDCLFIARRSTCRVYIIFYVDELLIFGREQTVSDVKKILA